MKQSVKANKVNNLERPYSQVNPLKLLLDNMVCRYLWTRLPHMLFKYFLCRMMQVLPFALSLRAKSVSRDWLFKDHLSGVT